jgi:uncharacterized protein (DUF1015 family)
MQQRYLSQSPYNLVRVILGERRDSDTDTDNVYTRAAGHLMEWIGGGVLERDPEPGFTVYSQEFTVPDTGERLTRHGFIGLGAVEDYSAGIVHRHEYTLAGPKKDRMEVLKATHAHFGQIFMLYPDPQGEIDALIAQVEQGAPDGVVRDEYDAVHRVWRVTDPELVAAFQQKMAAKKLLIADGHHRYETALNFRNAHPELADAGGVMMTFVNMYSPGLRILATHRVLGNLAGFDAASFFEKAQAKFTVTRLASLEDLKARWQTPAPGRARIGVAVADGVWLLEADRGQRLDLNLLHQDILDGLLGISEEAVRNESYIKYVRGIEPAVELVTSGQRQVAFLVEPVSVDDVARISFGGGVMPQKSTDFYPKLLSGLTIYKLEK